MLKVSRLVIPAVLVLTLIAFEALVEARSPHPLTIAVTVTMLLLAIITATLGSFSRGR